jgi:hypothetical protein
MASSPHAAQITELPETNTDISQDRVDPDPSYVTLNSKNASLLNRDTLDLVTYLMKDCKVNTLPAIHPTCDPHKLTAYISGHDNFNYT